MYTYQAGRMPEISYEFINTVDSAFSGEMHVDLYLSLSIHSNNDEFLSIEAPEQEQWKSSVIRSYNSHFLNK